MRRDWSWFPPHRRTPQPNSDLELDIPENYQFDYFYNDYESNTILNDLLDDTDYIDALEEANQVKKPITFADKVKKSGWRFLFRPKYWFFRLK